MVFSGSLVLSSIATAAVATGLALGCAGNGASPNDRASSELLTAADGGALDPASCKKAVARLDSVGIRGENQPRATYYFDMRLRNPAGGPRWVILPETFPREGRSEPAPGAGTITRLSASRLSGRGRMMSVHASGPGGFRAILLPAGGKAILNELPILADWTVHHATAKIEVILAHDVAIDGVPLASWVHGSLVADRDADVTFGDPAGILDLAKPLAPGAAHTVSIHEDCRTTAQAILKHEEP